MALGKLEPRQEQEQEERKFLSIHHGKVELSENGRKSYFSYVEGALLSIYMKDRTFNGERVHRWFIELQDEEGELYVISFPYKSGTFKSIVLAMASVKKIKPNTIFRIVPYQKGKFTNVAVYADDAKLDWVIKELPPVKEVSVGSQIYKDDTARMNYIDYLVNEINSRITSIS